MEAQDGTFFKQIWQFNETIFSHYLNGFVLENYQVLLKK